VTTKLTPHPFQADPDLPADHKGRRVCAGCHLIGRPGDPVGDDSLSDSDSRNGGE
jgi:hypothetical protein